MFGQGSMATLTAGLGGGDDGSLRRFLHEATGHSTSSNSGASGDKVVLDVGSENGFGR